MQQSTSKPAFDASPIAADRGWTGLAGATAEARSRALLLAAIALVALLQLHLIFVQGINWDEFFYLSHIYQAREGTLRIALQTFHVRLFAWLPSVPGTEIEQIRAARLVMLGCELVTIAGIVAVARQFVSRNAALIAGLLFITGGYVFQHGFSFRADTIAAALLMPALAFALRGDFAPARCGAIALLVALAGLVTIKAVFYAPAFLGIALYRLAEADDVRALTRRLVATGLLCILLFAALYGFHDAGLRAAGLDNSKAVLGSASNKMFSMGFLPRGEYVLEQLLLAPLLAAAVLAAPFVLASAKRSRAEKAALAGLLLPIATLLIYRNSFPYYYAFILPPVAAAASVVLPEVVRRYGVGVIAGALAANAALLYAATPRDMQAVQRTLFQAVHQIFPRPVAYIDFCSMLATFPKQGFFMSGWGMEQYREAGRPVLNEAIAGRTIPLIVANHSALLDALSGPAGTSALLPEDARTVRANFVHHWGPLWVAGKRIGAGVRGAIRIAVPGEYRLEQHAISIGGRTLVPGETIVLDRGPYAVSGPQTGEAVLRWAAARPRPRLAESAPGRFGIFSDF